ncbi:MAG TPA: hypothetical protein ENN79_14735, partial [Desulfobacteraceae bacterium]|nr:hypothetical protein [Desulfobacteraceae bacterium]
MKHHVYTWLFLAVAILFQGCAGVRKDVRLEPAREVVEISPRVLDDSIKKIEALMEKRTFDEQQKSRARELIAAIEDLRNIPAPGTYVLSTRLEKVLETASTLIHESLYGLKLPETQKSVLEDTWIDLHKRLLSAYRA